MRQITASGQTIEEAVQSALRQLNTTKDQVTVDVIDEGKKGLFGVFGSKQAIVKVTKNMNPIQQAEAYLKNVTTKMGVEVEIKTTVHNQEIVFELVGEKIAILIGKRGQTLNALQYLLHLVVNKKKDHFYTVVLDAEGYRKRRKETLYSLAERLAEKAIRTRREVSLEPMPSFERKIIHTALQDNNRVETYSDGIDPNRHVVIKP
ncbi:protein jag [Aquibacillus sp. 3ASR75-11]|uniref:RNA-binding protein KhpB n=1 Tax=Terrihalobacillus insolitus TaxID=2950438 RepID=A0A9X3WUR6_9BACI|nr:RNA-binding cell elongation regulator Jag/EloR [Terrihalobacillus insolitus]MDC3414913.1 protein jag [Terrihalobacillus insolitus]MDC3426000.1 protein jag [Terrihalobacillus insolitus]